MVHASTPPDASAPPEGAVREGRLEDAVRRLLAVLSAPEMARWRPRMALALGLTIIAKGFVVAAPVFFGEGINAITEATSGDAAGAAGAAGLAFLGFFLLNGLARFLASGAPQARDALFAPVSQDAQRLTAVNAFGHVQNLSLNFHQSKRTGAVSRTIDRGANAIDFLLRILVFNILPIVVELALAATVIGFAYGWKFSAIAVVAVLAYAGATWAMTEWRVRLRRVMNEADTEVNARAVDALSNFETVKAFAAEQREADRYDDAKSRYASAAVKVQQSLAALNAVQSGIMNAGFLVMALLAGWEAVNGRLQVGDVAALTLILMNIYQPLNILGWAYREIKQASVDLERLSQLLDQRPQVADRPNAAVLERISGAVRFEAVSFSHPGRAPSVDAVDLEVPAGAMLGLAGPSGAGKSTLLRLLLRFFDPDSGRILIDGRDVASVTQESLRSHIAVVPQEVVLFNDTLRANVLYGRPDADEEAVRDALERAQLGGFAEQLPDGLETRVGERGVKLSGGERQRVGVARAILKNPAILVLDEATSALDSRTEIEVQAALAEAAKGRTTLAVAHRLSTIARADQIAVMEEGRVVELGDHAALLAREGLYASMWAAQADAADRASREAEQV